MSYLFLVDEEKHDAQDLQEEDEQEEDEELWRHKGERVRGQLSYLAENRSAKGRGPHGGK